MLSNLSEAEKTAYKTCEIGAKTAVDYAKCVVMVMNIIRDNKKQMFSTDPTEFNTNNDNCDLLSRIRHFIDILKPKRKSLFNITSMNVKIKNNQIKINLQNIPYYDGIEDQKFPLYSMNNCSKTDIKHNLCPNIVNNKSIRREYTATKKYKLNIKELINRIGNNSSSNIKTAVNQVNSDDEIASKFVNYKKKKLNNNYKIKFDNPIAAKEFLLEMFRYRRSVRRNKRNTGNIVKKKMTLQSLKNLQKLNEYVEMQNFCENFLKRLNDENSR